MREMNEKTEEAVKNLGNAYKQLCKGKFERASGIFFEVQILAGEICTEVEKIRDAFQARCNESETMLENIYEKNEDFNEKKDIIQTELAKMQSQMEAYEALSVTLKKQLEDINEQYRKVEKKEERAAERAFALDITGAVLGGIGGLAGAIVDGVVDLVKGSGENTEKTAGNGDKTDKETGQEKEAAKSPVTDENKKQLSDAQQKIDEAEKEKKEKEEELSQIKEELKTLDGDQLEEKRKEADAKEEEIKALDEKINKEKDIKKTLEESFAKLGEGFSKVADKQASMAEMYGDRLEQIYKTKVQLMDMERENTENLIKYISMVKSASAQSVDLTEAIASTVTAISCMKKIVVVLNNMVMFWQSVEKSCRYLAELDFSKKINELIEDEDVAIENAEAFFKGEYFVEIFFRYVLRWNVLNCISGEYVNSMIQLKKESENVVGQDEGSVKEQREKAATLAASMATSIENVLQNSLN